MPFDAHLDDAQLDAWVAGPVSEEALHPVRAHLVKCKVCRKKAAAKWKAVPAPTDVEGFELGELVRTDAFRQVFKGKHTATGTTVAVAVLRALTIDSSTTERTLAPTRAAEALQNPALAAVVAVGYLPAGTPWVASEWVEGTPLDLVLQKERFSRQELLTLLWALADPLSALHKAGLVHGHLSGSLVMSQGNPRGLVLLDATLVMPEAQATPADDLWALGGILFEALTGRPPTNSPSLPPLEPAGFTELALGLLDPHGPSRPTADETLSKLLQLGAQAHRPAARDRPSLVPLAPLKRPPPPPPPPVDPNAPLASAVPGIAAPSPSAPSPSAPAPSAPPPPPAPSAPGSGNGNPV